MFYKNDYWISEEDLLVLYGWPYYWPNYGHLCFITLLPCFLLLRKIKLSLEGLWSPVLIFVYFSYKQRLRLTAFNNYVSTIGIESVQFQNHSTFSSVHNYCVTRVPYSFPYIEIFFQVIFFITLQLAYAHNAMHNATYAFLSPVFDTKSLGIYAIAMNRNLHKNA